MALDHALGGKVVFYFLAEDGDVVVLLDEASKRMQRVCGADMKN